LLTLALVAPAEAAPPKKASPSPGLDADNLATGVFSGTLVNTPDSDRLFTVEVPYQKLQLKPGQNLSRANQNLQRQYNHIAQLQNQLTNPGRRCNQAGSMQQLQRAVVQFQTQLAQTQANLFQVVNAKQRVDFQTEELVKVRLAELPPQFDDKGNIKKLTKDELLELKGKDKKLPGYESAVENLKVGQLVQVTLGVHKKPRPSSSSADKDKDKDADQDKNMSNEHKLQVRMIMILKDVDSSQLSTSQKKSKKNN
jgi:hypothetical protein